MNMKKKILLALIAILLTSPAWAKNKEQKLEEVVLDVPQEEMNVEEVPQAISVTEEKAPQEKSLKEKLKNHIRESLLKKVRNQKGIIEYTISVRLVE